MDRSIAQGSPPSGIPQSRLEVATGERASSRHLARTIAYWALTLVIAWEMTAGSLWDLLRIDYVRGVFAHLGYPLYLLLIIGTWKLPCAVALVVPRFPRLKEWAYAGAFFNYTGAAASHLLAGDRGARWGGPAVLALITLASWALRGPGRRTTAEPEPQPARIVDWLVPLVLVAAMAVLSLLTLPKGAPPS